VGQDGILRGGCQSPQPQTHRLKTEDLCHAPRVFVQGEAVSVQGETMFEQATLSNADAGRRACATGFGFVGEAMLAGFIALVPMIWPEAMPKPQALLMLLTPPAPVPPRSNVMVKPRAAQTIFAPPLFTFPTNIPTMIATLVDDPPATADTIPNIGAATGDPNGLPAILNVPAAPPIPPVAVKNTGPQSTVEPAPPRRIRTSSLELARLLHRVEPVYPAVAKMVHVQGAVELKSVIGTDGHIRELKALSGNPLLIKAAIDAVSQWIYAPPVLNRERVEVIAPITVNFRLDR
jgi:protein TonB